MSASIVLGCTCTCDHTGLSFSDVPHVASHALGPSTLGSVPLTAPSGGASELHCCRSLHSVVGVREHDTPYFVPSQSFLGCLGSSVVPRSSSGKNAVGILTGTELHLYVTLGSEHIFPPF